LQDDLLDYYLELSPVEIKREVFVINLTNSCSHLSCPCFPFFASVSCAAMKLELGVIRAWKRLSHSVILSVYMVINGNKKKKKKKEKKKKKRRKTKS
jgi:hypothetical protein